MEATNAAMLTWRAALLAWVVLLIASWRTMPGACALLLPLSYLYSLGRLDKAVGPAAGSRRLEFSSGSRWADPAGPPGRNATDTILNVKYR
jgi:hypothetical protein